ncbi:aldehyde oxidase GLOX [Amborella trichopoda]|uniref:Galactose oxidase-like Early set domain-containing protein n=1 Tax=Amborella trichopoda TaxID=13333 RepID=W1NLZ3_AMBTC|nr:aldehyde oxidase GLOX [Amborella trichopoda]ERM96279.1 hypothetical protein AMTR_s00001p00165980 [Amborella trichopoda]|eukprot:XP_006828863.1 aldehyde oxidase GLOX [Amborella trichopoda]
MKFPAILLPLLLFFLCFWRSESQTPFLDGGGAWEVLQQSIGISAMHMQLMPNDKVVMFDRTDFGSSNISLPSGQCRTDPHQEALTHDCSAHSVEYTIATNSIRPLTIQTDTWCSSGSLDRNGQLIQTGGFRDGDRVVRTISSCDACDWTEYPENLAVRRWYATDLILPDGRIIIVGGRRQYNYEFYPQQNPNLFELGFLRETSDQDENNLYPFLHLLPDGTLFIFTNTRAVLFDYNGNRVLRELPAIPGGEPRNYPSSGSSVLLPLTLTGEAGQETDPEILLCGGAPFGSFDKAVQGEFLEASSTCGRIRPMDPQAQWAMETMPMGRVMGDMLLLPNGEVLIINGAGNGTAGWEFGRNPVKTPVIYSPSLPLGQRFQVLNPSSTPRLYHSTATVIPDGRVLVGGSNPHTLYQFYNQEFPTDLSLEAFLPPYLSMQHLTRRPRIVSSYTQPLSYAQPTEVMYFLADPLPMGEITVRLLAPSFTTHSFGMNQRLLTLKVAGEVVQLSLFTYRVTVLAPPNPNIAPPGYYMMFVVHSGVPSAGVWVQMQ